LNRRGLAFENRVFAFGCGLCCWWNLASLGLTAGGLDAFPGYGTGEPILFCGGWKHLVGSRDSGSHTERGEGGRIEVGGIESTGVEMDRGSLVVLENMGQRLDPDPAGFAREVGLWDVNSGVEDPAHGGLDTDGDWKEGWDTSNGRGEIGIGKNIV
jgi:hypothetical protein